MKIILFLAAVYALIINQAQQKKTPRIQPERSNQTIQLQSLATDSLVSNAMVKYPFSKDHIKRKAPTPAVIQYTALRPMIVGGYGY